MDSELQALGGGVRLVQQGQVVDQADRIERLGLDAEAAGLRGLGIERGVQHRDQVLGRVERCVQLFARRRGATAPAGGGGQHMGDAGQAVADFVTEGGDNVGLAARGALGRLQHPQAFLDQMLVLDGQVVLAAEHAVQDQGQGHGQGDGAPGQLAQLAVAGEGGDQRAGRRDRRDDQQAGQIRRGEEGAQHRAGRGQHEQRLSRRSRAQGEGRDLHGGQGPEHAAHHLNSRPAVKILRRFVAQPVHHRVEGAPVDGEHREAGGHPDAVRGERSDPHEQGQADRENPKRVR